MEVVNYIKKFDWIRGVERPGSPLKDSLASLNPSIPVLIVGRNKKSIWYLDRKKFSELYLEYKELFKGFIHNKVKASLAKRTLEKIESICIETSRKLLNMMKKNYRKMSFDKLRIEWERLVEIYEKYAEVLVPFLPLDKALTDIATEVFGEKIKIVAIPEKPLRIEIFLEDSIKMKLYELFEKYGYLFAYDFLEVPMAFDNMIKSLGDTEGIDYKRYEEFNEFLNKLGKNKRKLAKIISKAVWLRTERTDVLKMFFFVGHKIIRRISELLDILYEDLCYYTVEEIRSLLKNKKLIENSVIKRRKEGYYLFVADSLRIMSEKVDDIIPILEKGKKDVRILKGTVASNGGKDIVEGEVKIVRNFDDLKSIEGKILVTSMTTPDYIVFMKKVLGIVTDEGGITCHAAIVSRELNIPCIVGTRKATSILKDGMRVKLDLRNGLVIILGN